MKWFKFYGQDFLTDSKLGSLHPLQRLMWVGLLCIASQDDKKTGIIKFLTEDRLMDLCGVRLEDLEACNVKQYVTLETFCNMRLVTCPDKNTFIITNYNKKQTQSSTSTERVAEWRVRNRAIKSNYYNETDVTNVTLQSNSRVDKNRIDKNTLTSPLASETPLLAKQTNMHKNKLGSYREDSPSDAYENVIDADTGEAEKVKPKGDASKVMLELLEWGASRRGSGFINLGKQYKAMALMRKAGKQPADIKNRWTELEKDDFHKKKGFDFMDIANSFDRK